MSEAANFTINDGAATPVAITFKPEMISGGNATFRDDRSGVFNLMPRIKANTSLSTASRPTNRVQTSVSLPVSKTVDGVVVVDYTLRFEGQWILPERCTEADRANLLALACNSLQAEPIKSTVLKVEPIFG